MSQQPYPGLRPFRQDETDIFFGREDQVDEQLIKLEHSHFLAVTGPSGCGKSSLVRTDLVEALKIGSMTSAGTRWRIVDLRPGDAPMWYLATALHTALKPEESKATAAPIVRENIREIADWHAILSAGLDGLMNLVSKASLPDGTHLLLLVDQFEEIFRFRSLMREDVNNEDAKYESEEFVALLIEAARQRDLPIFVILTMRTGFLEYCFEFDGLPAMINQSQFLTPLLNESQLRRAIIGPAKVYGGNVSLDLVNRLIADISPNPDDLPLLQHALMCIWNHARARAGDKPVQMTVDDYNAVGGLREALSHHADEALQELEKKDPTAIPLAEVLFRELTERTGGVPSQDIRRPRRVTEIAQVAGLTRDEWRRITPVVEVFRDPSRCFITTRSTLEATEESTKEITEETVLDISHESLIRQWKRLREWVKKEADKAQKYEDLVHLAEAYTAGRAKLLDALRVRDYSKWWNDEKPNAAWANRYFGAFEHTKGFLEKSIAAKKRRLGGISVLLVIFFLAVGYGYWQQWEKVVNARKFAEERLILLQGRHSILASQSESHLKSEPGLSLLLAVEAQLMGERIGGTIPSRRALGTALGQKLVTATLPTFSSPLAGHTDNVENVAVSPSGKTLASVSNEGTVILWDIATGKALGAPLASYKGSLRTVVFSPDGKTLATGNADNSFTLWDTATQKRLGDASYMGHKNSVTSVAFSPDGKLLASGSYDKTIILWDVATAKPHGQPFIRHTDIARSVAFSPDGKTLASGSYDKTIILWDVATGKPLGEPLRGHDGQLRNVAFNPDGTILASGGADDTIMLWDVAARKRIGTPLPSQGGAVWSVAFSPNGKTLASGNANGTVLLWDEATLKEFSLPPAGTGTDSTHHLTVSPDGSIVACAKNSTNAIILRDVTTDAELGSPFVGHKDPVTTAAFSPDGKTLASGSEDNTVILWDVVTRKPKTSPLTGHKGSVTSVTFSRPDGKTLASGGADHTVILWDVASGQQKGALLTGHTDRVQSMAFSPDGRILASGSWDHIVRLWDVNTTPVRSQPLNGHESSVTSVTFSPDGKTLASTSFDKSIILWDTTFRQEILRLNGHTDVVWSVVFSPDGRQLASASFDNTVILWDVSVESWLARACRGAGRPLTEEEWGEFLIDEKYRDSCSKYIKPGN